MFASSKSELDQPSCVRFRLSIPGWPAKRKKPWQIPRESTQVDRDELIELFRDKLREDGNPFKRAKLEQMRRNKSLQKALYN